MASRPSTKRHPVFARFYARISPTTDAQGAVEHRRTLLAGLAGRALEVGAGNGLNFAHYPPAVTGFEVTSLERFRFRESRLPQPAAPHVLGVAQRRPAPGQRATDSGRSRRRPDRPADSACRSAQRA